MTKKPPVCQPIDPHGMRQLVLAAIAHALAVVEGKDGATLEDARREAAWLQTEGADWLDALTMGEGGRGGEELKRRAAQLLAERSRGNGRLQRRPGRPGRHARIVARPGNYMQISFF